MQTKGPEKSEEKVFRGKMRCVVSGSWKYKEGECDAWQAP